MKPILRWVGGKTKLIPSLVNFLPPDYAARTHVEPFAGSAALFFHLEPRHALLNDLNADLMHFYACVRHDPGEVLSASRWIDRAEPTALWYKKLREDFNALRRTTDLAGPHTHTPAAATFWAINRSCFNGIFRVNSRGEFNVPYAKRRIGLPDDLDYPSELLKRAVLVNTDARTVIAQTGAKDFVYVDPPYPQTYDGYTKAGFNEADFFELEVQCREAFHRGACVVVSCNDTKLVRDVFRRWKVFSGLRVRHTVAAKSENRKAAAELIFVSPRKD